LIQTAARTLAEKPAEHTDSFKAKSVKDTKQKSYDAAALNASDAVGSASCVLAGELQ
jgi:hypothetical protein